MRVIHMGVIQALEMHFNLSMTERKLLSGCPRGDVARRATHEFLGCSALTAFAVLSSVAVPCRLICAEARD
jgi:hypothetical protein